MRFRIDFGRVFPGLLLLISGLVLFALLLIIAIVSFLFSFLPAFETTLRATLELMLLSVILIVAGIITILTGVSWWGKGGLGWFSGIARVRALRDRLALSSRVGELIGIVIGLLVFYFLYENQLRGVAFFTTSFGATAQFLFYCPLFTGMVLSLARAMYGRRNAIRPFDALQALFLVVSALWLLSVFPFDFTHFADMFPTSIHFIFSWLNNDIGRLLFMIAGLAAVCNVVYTTVLYSAVRGQLLHMSERPV